MSEDFLDTMARASRARVTAAQAVESEASLFHRAFATPDPPRLKLSPQGFDLIAEVKLRSPAVGQLKGGEENVAARVGAYAEAGAAAVSVLTEPTRFDGSLEHLRLAAQALAAAGPADGVVPAMRKDFLVDPYQVAEARLAGAGGILIILRMLSRGQIEALVEAAARLKLFVLAETFDEADIGIAQELVRSPVARDLDLLVGLNSRDLATLKVVPGRLEQLADRLPGTVPRVAESGVGSAADAARLAAAGYDLALVGSALMTSADPPLLLADMLREGRAARSQ
jgi:indole-3-glycerol phosphate synthase